jgi:Xaa-Pro aminopeptidase
MSATMTEPLVALETDKADAPAPPGPPARPVSDRRSDIDAKHEQVAALLAEHNCEGLMVLDPANLAWLTSGAAARNVLDPEEWPGVYYTAAQRWLVASNIDAQRMFDEELDEMGYLLKEWPWSWRREQLVTALCQSRPTACDTALPGTKPVGDALRLLRRKQSIYDQACAKLLGQLLAHALEASCRTVQPGDTEREFAGQIGHRLLRRGAYPVSISVAADGRSRRYRRQGFTAVAIEKSCVVSATARKYGLHVSATRSFSFGAANEEWKKDHITACKVGATYSSHTYPDALVGEILVAGRRTFLLTGAEHEWQLGQQGYVTGRVPVEASFYPDSEEVLKAGWLMVWQPTVQMAAYGDTFLIDDKGPVLLTPAEEWPVVGVKIAGVEVPCPSILER